MAEGESLGGHATRAGQQALEMAGVDAGEIDLVLLATSTPDDLFGSACQVLLRCSVQEQSFKTCAMIFVPRC